MKEDICDLVASRVLECEESVLGPNVLVAKLQGLTEEEAHKRMLLQHQAFSDFVDCVCSGIELEWNKLMKKVKDMNLEEGYEIWNSIAKPLEDRRILAACGREYLHNIHE